MDFNQQNVLPAVLINVISVLENGNEPVSWTLSRTWKGQFSLTVKSPAIVKGKVDIPTQRPQDAEKAAPEWNISKQKRKKPSRARRDRKRWTKWYQKKKAGTSASPTPLEPPKPSTPAGSEQLEFRDQALESSSKKQDSNTERAHSKTAARLEQPVCSEQEKGFSVSCLEIDSDDDCDEDVIESPNFCANCYLAPPAVTLKKCSKCQISQYCSISCHKENWGQHKFACSIVADQRASKGLCK